ncbi:MAG: DUF2500 domain-containing protein [Christensenellaceae bacterium]
MGAFEWFSSMFFVAFGLILLVFLAIIVGNLVRWQRNNRSPRLTVSARVVTKRQASHHHHNASTHISSTSHSYYATFEVESGDRMELMLSGPDYGMIAEGDRGKLTFQGTRFLSFEREGFEFV